MRGIGKKLYISTQKRNVMEKKVVKIPHIVEELRIGYSFNHLIRVEC